MKILPNNLKPYIGFKFIARIDGPIYIIIEEYGNWYICNYTLSDDINTNWDSVANFSKEYLNISLKKGIFKRVG